MKTPEFVSFMPDPGNPKPDFSAVLAGSKRIQKIKKWQHSVAALTTLAVISAGIWFSQMLSSNKVENQSTNLAKTKPELPPETNTTTPLLAPENAVSAISKPQHSLPAIFSEEFTILAESGARIVTKNGSVIILEANSLRDQNGTMVKGKVKINFTPIMDVADMLLSGVGMTYDSGGIHRDFKSAGMFEINATQNGQELTLIPNGKSAVYLASPWMAGKEFNQYFKNERDDNWKYIAPAVTLSPDQLPAPISELIAGKTTETPDAIYDIRSTYYISMNYDPKEFPELGELGKRTFYLIYERDVPKMRNNTYNQVKINKHPLQKGIYIISYWLKDELVVTIDVVPTKFENSAQNVATLNKKMADYARYISNMENMKISQKSVEDQAMQDVVSRLSAEEKITMEDRVKEMKKRGKISQKVNEVFSVFQLSGFGFYNSDCPMSFPIGPEVIAKLSLDQPSDILRSSFYMADRSSNTLFTISPNSQGEYKFTYAPGADYLFCIIDNSAGLFINKDPNFEGEGNIQLPMKLVEAKQTQDIKKLLLK